MLRTLALVLGLGLVACGGGSKQPAAQEPAEEESSEENLPDDSNMPVENEQCCCDAPSADGEGDRTYSWMSVGDCEEAAGTCDEAAVCGE